MKTVTTLYDYCREVNIPPPKHAFFDIRRFEDKVKTENAKQAPFRHEFYSVALRHMGENKSVNGTPLEANLFFNSPYQVVSWDVLPVWKGWYIMFGHDFLAHDPAWRNFTVDFPFFQLDKTFPFDLPPEDVAIADNFFNNIFKEYHSNNEDKFYFIQSYTSLLLLLTRRYFNGLAISEEASTQNRTTDILLLSRFQTMVKQRMVSEEAGPEARHPSYYAGKLNVHPNHLNAVVKHTTGKTAGALISNELITSAKSLLRQTHLSIKEVAFRLHFKEPTHFTSFFKKCTGFTPQQYKENSIL